MMCPAGKTAAGQGSLALRWIRADQLGARDGHRDRVDPLAAQLAGDGGDRASPRAVGPRTAEQANERPAHPTARRPSKQTRAAPRAKPQPGRESVETPVRRRQPTPVKAVQGWLQAAGITEGLLFRAIWRGGRLKPQGLRGCRTGGEVLRRAGGPRSGRVQRASVARRLRHQRRRDRGRHKSVDVLSGYVRRVDLFKDHAGAGFL
jgi:hypothetical protein